MITVVVVFHVACGVIAVLAGAGAMRTVKSSRRHRRLGRVYLLAVAGLCASAPILAALDWAHRWHLVVLAGSAAALVGVGLVGARRRRWSAHIAGTGGAYIVLLTAFYVDTGLGCRCGTGSRRSCSGCCPPRPGYRCYCAHYAAITSLLDNGRAAFGSRCEDR